jgi:hypothetical protein
MLRALGAGRKRGLGAETTCTHQPLLKKYFILVTIKYIVSPHLFIVYIILHLLYSPLITLSKYIHMGSSFEEFIETNLMVQSEFNLVFWFISYNIFYIEKCWTRFPRLSLSCPSLARTLCSAACFLGQCRRGTVPRYI